MPTVAEAIVEELVGGGVSRLFGVLGSSSRALSDAAERCGFPVVLCHHEWAACVMAAVTGELTGRPGAVLTSADATANATGLAHAYLDRIPLLHLSDPRRAASPIPSRLGADPESGRAELLGPIVKASMALAPNTAARQVVEAVRLVLQDPPGPVHLELPSDLASPASPAGARETLGVAALDVTAVDRAGAMILGARRPLVLAGGLCRPSDTKWLRAFCEAIPTPVLTTYKGKGAVPDPHPLNMGVLTGGALEQPVLARADLIVAFGLDPVELIPRPWPYRAPVLSLTPVASDCAVSRAPTGVASFAPALEVVGDLGAILEDLAPRLVGQSNADWDLLEVDRLRRVRLAALEIAVPGLAAHRIVQFAREVTPAGTTASVDMGPHLFVVAAYWHAVELHELLVSGGLGLDGFALPAAIAAQLAYPERHAICFTDARGLLVAAGELETAARLRLPLVIVVFDDGGLALAAPEGDPASPAGAAKRYRGPDVAAIGRGFGLRAFVAADEATFRSAFLSALAAAGPTLIHARIDPASHLRALEVVAGATGS
jgi:acetolactate synthase-1/2/3 large subunit